MGTDQVNTISDCIKVVKHIQHIIWLKLVVGILCFNIFLGGAKVLQRNIECVFLRERAAACQSNHQAGYQKLFHETFP